MLAYIIPVITLLVTLPMGALPGDPVQVWLWAQPAEAAGMCTLHVVLCSPLTTSPGLSTARFSSAYDSCTGFSWSGRWFWDAA